MKLTHPGCIGFRGHLRRNVEPRPTFYLPYFFLWWNLIFVRYVSSEIFEIFLRVSRLANKYRAVYNKWLIRTTVLNELEIRTVPSVSSKSVLTSLHFFFPQNPRHSFVHELCSAINHNWLFGTEGYIFNMVLYATGNIVACEEHSFQYFFFRFLYKKKMPGRLSCLLVCSEISWH